MHETSCRAGECMEGWGVGRGKAADQSMYV